MLVMLEWECRLLVRMLRDCCSVMLVMSEWKCRLLVPIVWGSSAMSK